MCARVLAFFAFACVVAPVGAQTFYGPGGLIINPTAYFNRAGYVEFNASFFNRQTSSSTTSIYPSSLTYTLDRRLEVGGLYVGQRTGTSNRDLGGVYLKQGLVDERGGRPAIAVVGTSLTGDGTTSSLTLVASKELAPGLHLHLGARYMNYSFDRRADGNVIAGMDAAVAPHFRLLGEADSRLHPYQYGSAAFGVQYSGQVVVTVGVVSQASGRYGFFVGVGYPIGKT